MDPKPVDFDLATRTEIIRRVVDLLRDGYVFPAIAEQIGARLQAGLETDEYAALTAPEAFASAITQQMQAISQDKHLRLRWYAEPLPEEAGGGLAANDDWLTEWRRQAELENYGLYKVERLPGNVGYVDIRVFHDVTRGGNTASAAMTFLSHTHALILDLRQCRGGDANMVALILSYLFSNPYTQLNSIYTRNPEHTKQYWTSPYVPGGRYGDKPVYVLTSNATFSAGEAFAYDLQANKRATVVGEVTRGGAHPGGPHRLHPHLDIFIPSARAINPITGTDWEGTGVTPDLPVPEAQAFAAAYRLALQQVLEQLGPATTSRSLNQLRDEAQAALAEVAPKAAD